MPLDTAETILTLDSFLARLRDWHRDDHQGFRTLFDNAVKFVNPIPAGTDPNVVHDWKNATIDDLCAFFTDWYAWLPDVPTGLEYIQRFSWLYYENPYGLVFVTTGAGREMTELFVTLRGQYMDSAASLPLVARWEKELGDQMDQFVVPPGGFQNFNQFFAREVKPGMRPISAPDDDSIVVASADCIINMIVDNLALDTRLTVKTVSLDITQLLDGSKYAEKFVGGTAVSCILMPNTYHRFHAPVGGQVVESNADVEGLYFGINDFPDLLDRGNVGYGYDYSVFERFRRGYLIYQTEGFGYVGMVPVGLNTIASVIFDDRFKRIGPGDMPAPVSKGEEIGYFQYGGSLNILLFEPGRFSSLSMLQGQRIGQLTGN